MDQGGKITDFNFTADVHNITEGIDSIVGMLNKAPGYKKTYVYKTLTTAEEKGGEPKVYSMSFALRLLIHYVGDIHQPLHAAARVDKNYPRGDFGGNAVPLKAKDDITELHAVWDSVVYEFEGYANLPLSDTDWIAQGKTASKLAQEHKINKAQAANLDCHAWASESFDIAKDFVYRGVVENAALSDSYV